MCGRYSFSSPQNIDSRYQPRNGTPVYPARLNIPPSTMNPVITQENGKRKVELMKWGLVPSWSKGERVKFSTINARVERLEESPVYRDPFKRHRCLIPFTSFIEWKRHKENGKEEKIPFNIFVKNAPEGIASFAGLYDIWHEGEKEELRSYTICTTVPNRLMESIHDRMPVILKDKDESTWLDGKIENMEIVKRLLKPYPASYMDAYPISRAINSPENQDEWLLKPLNK